MLQHDILINGMRVLLRRANTDPPTLPSLLHTLDPTPSLSPIPLLSLLHTLWITFLLMHGADSTPTLQLYSHLVDHIPANAWCRQHPPALPEALEEAAVVAVVGHTLGCEKVKLNHLNAP